MAQNTCSADITRKSKKRSKRFHRKVAALTSIVLSMVFALTAFVIPVNAAVLREGSRGDTVKQVQERLKQWGYYTGSVDGIFGAKTKSAVKSFQKSNGLTQDGIVGPATFKALGMSSTSSGSTGGGVGGSSDSDYKLLANIISAEARGESYTGQVAVGAVILNRVKHPSFPNTIAGVIYQAGAFTAITDGQINQPVADSAYRAARDALNGMDPSGGALYYYNPSKTSNKWMLSRPVIVQIGEHLFCA